MDNNQKIIKQLNPCTCPYCKKDFFIGTQSLTQAVVSTPTLEEIKEAKTQIKERINEITFAQESDKEQVINYIDDESTLLDSSDIEPLLKQIAMDQVEKLNNKKDEKSK